jgi:hypothetical protein
MREDLGDSYIGISKLVVGQSIMVRGLDSRQDLLADRLLNFFISPKFGEVGVICSIGRCNLGGSCGCRMDRLAAWVIWWDKRHASASKIGGWIHGYAKVAINAAAAARTVYGASVRIDFFSEEFHGDGGWFANNWG